MKQLPNEIRSIVEGNDSLKRYLGALAHGKPFTPRSWLYENLDASEVLDKWMRKLTILKDSDNEFERRVFQFDTSQLSKWGPQGGVAPISELLPSLEESFSGTPKPEAFSTPEWERAKAEATYALAAAISGGRLQPVSYDKVIIDMKARDTLESNSGFPDYGRRSNPQIRSRAVQDARSGKWREYPAIVLFRNYNNKTRPVWMYPMSTNLVEGSFCQPLQSALMRSDLAKDFFSPWSGFQQVRELVSRIYNSTQDTIAASDFSETDKHFRWETTEQVYDVIAPLYQPQFRESLKESLYHMHSIPLLVGLDSMLDGMHGVSSGSVWTNFIETIFDFILGKYVSILRFQKFKGFKNNVYGLYGIGDDMSWWLDRTQPTFAKWLAEVGLSVGQIIKDEKTTNERDWVKSLQRLFQRGYKIPNSDLVRAVYSTIRALKSSVYPERFHNPRKWNSDMFCARQYMILENCVDHPLFTEFVAFVTAGQKDLRPFARKSAHELNRIQRDTHLLPGFNPTYNQEKRDSKLSEFASIEIARQL